jgi:hypothetical protein
MKAVTALAVLFAAGSSHHVQACTCKRQIWGLIDDMTVIHNTLRQRDQTHSQPGYVTMPTSIPCFQMLKYKKDFVFYAINTVHTTTLCTSCNFRNFMEF